MGRDLPRCCGCTDCSLCIECPLLETECFCPLPPYNSHVEILIPNTVILGGRAFGRCLGPEGGALLNGISALIKETPRSSLIPSALTRGWMSVNQEAGAHHITSPGTLISDFPASRTVQNKCLLFVSPPVCVFCYSCPNKRRHSSTLVLSPPGELSSGSSSSPTPPTGLKPTLCSQRSFHSLLCGPTSPCHADFLTHLPSCPQHIANTKTEGDFPLITPPGRKDHLSQSLKNISWISG